jgi:hypothetical protein
MLCSISVAWCKQMEVPIEKIYTKVLLEKFGVRAACAKRVACFRLTRTRLPQWSMEVEPTFDF